MKTVLRNALLAAVMVGAAALPATAYTHSANAAAVPRCQTGTLSVSTVKNSSQGGMGHVGFFLSIRSFAQHTCFLFGYPGVQLIDAQARFLPTHLTWGTGYLFGSPAKQMVVLKTGGTAYFGLEWVHFPTGNEACPVAANLLVTPPDETVSIVVPVSSGIDACGGRLTATAVEATIRQ